MTVVLDVSASIEILFQREKSSAFKSVYNRAESILAPDLFISEITNVLWKCFKAGSATNLDCVGYVQDGIEMVDHFVEASELWKEALEEGMKNSHPIYDMYYAVLARRCNATLITNDKALAKICEELSIKICS